MSLGMSMGCGVMRWGMGGGVFYRVGVMGGVPVLIIPWVSGGR